MYVWIWRHLPGGLPGRLAGSVVLVAGVVLLLFTVVFPAVEPLVPFNDVTVDGAGTTGVDEPVPAGSAGP